MLLAHITLNDALGVILIFGVIIIGLAIALWFTEHS